MLGVPVRGFAAAVGYATKPATVRLRFGPDVLAMPSGLSEAVLRTEDLGRLVLRPRRALIVENEITWLTGLDVDYWGEESSPTAALLATLDAAERALYPDLLTDRYGAIVRLEQERIDGDRARGRLAGGA